jgi:hypothetical protein
MSIRHPPARSDIEISFPLCAFPSAVLRVLIRRTCGSTGSQATSCGGRIMGVSYCSGSSGCGPSKSAVEGAQSG